MSYGKKWYKLQKKEDKCDDPKELEKVNIEIKKVNREKEDYWHMLTAATLRAKKINTKSRAEEILNMDRDGGLSIAATNVTELDKDADDDLEQDIFDENMMMGIDPTEPYARAAGGLFKRKRMERKYRMKDPIHYRNSMLSKIKKAIDYLVHERKMKLDEHCHEQGGYKVCSLYLDSPAFKTYRSREHGEKDRFKLRIRFYDNDGPVWLEMKRRDGFEQWKYRAKLKREFVPQLLQGKFDYNWLIDSEDDHSRKTLLRFNMYITQYDFKAALFVQYERIPLVNG